VELEEVPVVVCPVTSGTSVVVDIVVDGEVTAPDSVVDGGVTDMVVTSGSVEQCCGASRVLECSV